MISTGIRPLRQGRLSLVVSAAALAACGESDEDSGVGGAAHVGEPCSSVALKLDPVAKSPIPPKNQASGPSLSATNPVDNSRQLRSSTATKGPLDFLRED